MPARSLSSGPSFHSAPACRAVWTRLASRSEGSPAAWAGGMKDATVGPRDSVTLGGVGGDPSIRDANQAFQGRHAGRGRNEGPKVRAAAEPRVARARVR